MLPRLLSISRLECTYRMELFFFNLPFFLREREKYASNRIYVQLIYKSFSPVFTKFQTDKFDSKIYVSYSLRLNRKPHTYMETRCTFSATNGREGCLDKGREGRPFSLEFEFCRNLFSVRTEPFFARPNEIPMADVCTEWFYRFISGQEFEGTA